MHLSELFSLALCGGLGRAAAFWDMGTTTTKSFVRTDWTHRQSRFRWQRSESDYFRLFYPWWNWYELEFRRRLYCVCGISYDMLNISTGAILNRRTVLTAANCLDQFMDHALHLRIWALGREGRHVTPYRYRAWRVTRVFPRSKNPEHQHGPWGYHSPRHDIAIVHTRDQMYVFPSISHRYHYAYRAFLPPHNRYHLSQELMYIAGSGYEYLEHVFENYKIFYTSVYRHQFRDCSEVLPKWWGKFLCLTNTFNFPGVQNGGGFFDYHLVVGFGCFEIRYNEDRVLVFTDMRYYTPTIKYWAHIYPGEYYEYAYPQWSITTNWLGLYSNQNDPYIPEKHIKDDMYPLG